MGVQYLKHVRITLNSNNYLHSRMPKVFNQNHFVDLISSSQPDPLPQMVGTASSILEWSLNDLLNLNATLCLVSDYTYEGKPAIEYDFINEEDVESFGSGGRAWFFCDTGTEYSFPKNNNHKPNKTNLFGNNPLPKLIFFSMRLADSAPQMVPLIKLGYFNRKAG